MINELFAWNSLNSLLWQYNEAYAVQSLLQSNQNFYDESTGQFFTDIVSNVMNLETANAFGLSIWGQYLKIPRPQYENDEGEVVPFTDDLYRLLLKAKLLKIHNRPTIPNINKFLQTLFPDQEKIYCVDNLDMTISIYFSSRPKFLQRGYVNIEDFLMRPAGVRAIVNFAEEKYFGFGDYFTPDTNPVIVGFGDYDSNPMGDGKFADYDDGV